MCVVLEGEGGYLGEGWEEGDGCLVEGEGERRHGGGAVGSDEELVGAEAEVEENVPAVMGDCEL